MSKYKSIADRTRMKVVGVRQGVPEGWASYAPHATYVIQSPGQIHWIGTSMPFGNIIVLSKGYVLSNNYMYDLIYSRQDIRLIDFVS